VSRRGVWRTNNTRHEYKGRAVGRAQRERSKITRGMPDVISLQDLERLLDRPAPPPKTRAKAHA
jgi:hypothetical protein